MDDALKAEVMTDESNKYFCNNFSSSLVVITNKLLDA